MTSFWIKTVGWRVISVLSSVTGNLIALRLCRNLPPAVFGAITVVVVILGYLPLLDGGFRMAINRRLLSGVEFREQKLLLEFGQRLYGWLALLAVLVVPIAVGMIGESSRAREVGLTPWFFVSLGVAGVAAFYGQSQVNLLTGLHKQWQVFALSAASAWANCISLWLGFQVGLDVWAFPISLLSGAVLTWGLAWILLRQAVPQLSILGRIERADWQRLWIQLRPESMAAFRNQVFTTLLYSIDPILVFFLALQPNESGSYAVVFRLMTILRSLLQSGDEASWPRIARDPATGARLSLSICRLNSWIHGAVTGSR